MTWICVKDRLPGKCCRVLVSSNIDGTGCIVCNYDSIRNKFVDSRTLFKEDEILTPNFWIEMNLPYFDE